MRSIKEAIHIDIQTMVDILDFVSTLLYRQRDGFQGYLCAAGKIHVGRPAVVRAGNIFQCCFSTFTCYMEIPTAAHKYLIN